MGPRMEEALWVIGPVIAGFLAGLVGARIARERESPKQLGRVSEGGIGTAVCVVMGSLGLVLCGSIVLSGDGPVPAFSIASATLLAAGIFSHLTDPRRT